MNNEVKLSVEEILNHESFQTAKIVAGQKGITRTVKWVHVMEITDVGNLLNGHELILSTGIGWKDSEALVSLVKQLIECRVAGLCVELGKYIYEIPNELIELADQYHFPIIVFNQEVRFVDITEKIHTLIIQKHYQMVSDLEEYSRKLNEALLEANPKEMILHMLHKQLQLPVIYLQKGDKDSIVSNQREKEKISLLQSVKENSIREDKFIARQKINVLNQDYAELVIIDEEDLITEFEKLLLDRTATALAQVILRELWTEERRKAKEIDWIQKWLNGEHNEEQIERYLRDIAPGIKLERAVVLLINLNVDPDDSNLTYLKLFLRNIFQDQGFYLLPAMMKNTLVLILIDNRVRSNFRQRVEVGIEQVLKSKYLSNIQNPQLQISVGKPIYQMTEIKKSYQYAKEASIIREKLSNEKTSYFYEDLHIYRIINAAHSQGILNEFVFDYLNPVIIYDQENNAKLMNTLKYYLKFNGSKKETAEQLFIVRQTLYHRIEKLYELIGENFMEPHKRQAIEFAVAAYEYLGGKKQTIHKEDYLSAKSK